MEASYKSRRRTETSPLLNSYRWQTVPQNGEKEPQFALSPASGHRGKQQRWRQAQSQTESELSEPSSEQTVPAVPPLDSRTAAKRFVFQRAFSTPVKMPKAQEGGRKLSLRKYLRSMSHHKNQGATPRPDKETKEANKGGDSAVTPSALVTAPDAPLWDVASVSLLDRQLVLLGRDEESLLQSRKRTSSTVSETSSVYPVLCGQMNYETSADVGSFLDAPAADKRRPPQEASSGPWPSRAKGLLWRRLRGRKEQIQAKTGSSAGLVASAHREVLPGPELLLDFSSEKNVLIRPLHSSLLGKQHCFEVLSAGGRHCFVCASAIERTRWMEDLRRVVQPNKDNCERMEHMLSLWIYEARDLAPRKHCFCELHLDGALYARTTTKQTSPTGAVFWGEHFDLRSLPLALELQVCLVQEEEEGQRHKGSAITSMAIPLSDLAATRQPLEKWYPMGRSKPSMPALRLRGRYCSIHVLPIVRYKEFAEYLTFHYRELCAVLEPSLNARDKEELAGALVRILQSTGKAKAFLIDLGIAELDRFDEREALIFRENTLATKAIDEYMKLLGGPYLLATLSEVIAHLYSLKNSCEVDPSKCTLSELPDNCNNLQQICEEVFQRIDRSSLSFPAELNEVFMAWQEECQVRGKAGIGQRLISASLFLRFLCPAIMSPSLFGLTQEYPDDATSRTLILVAKVIQNLANFTTFGEKEAYMSFMNEFLEHNSDAMTAFFNRVSGPGNTIPFADYGDSIDLPLELSILHSLLCNIFSSVDERTQERLEPLPTILHAIQKGTPVPVTIQLGPTTDQRGTENQKPGFVPPRELGKHNPLIKSHSMSNIQKVRGKEELLAPSPRTKMSKVQRTQSVPTQSKATRHARKQGSTEHVAKGRDGGPWPGTSHPCGSGSQASRECSKGPLTGSLPRKPAVPWLRHSEEVAATQGGFCAVQPLEQYRRQVEEIKRELTSAKEKQRLSEEEMERLTAQNQRLIEEQARFQEQEETLCKRLEDMESFFAQLNNRLSAVESSWKEDREKLRGTEERAQDLEHRLSHLERDHDQLLHAVSQMLEYQGKQPNSLQRPLSGPCG